MINKKELTKYKNNEVQTAIKKATEFYPAEKVHQEYLARNTDGYCNHRIRFTWED